MSRRLMRAPAPVNEQLEDLLRQAARHKMTPYEIWQQRVSFTYGQMMDCSPATTREQVEARAGERYGPCPARDHTGHEEDSL